MCLKKKTKYFTDLFPVVLFYFISIVNSRRQEMIVDEFTYSSRRIRKMSSYYYS